MTKHGNLRRPGNEIDRYIGNQVRNWRRKLNLSDNHIAHSLGMPPDQLREVESGRVRLSASDLFILARSFQLPLSYFFSDHGEYFSDIILDDTEMADVFHYFSNIENRGTRHHLLKQIKLASSVF